MHHRSLLAITAPGLLLFAGCAVTQLTTEGAAVELGTTTPPGCTFLGTVSGNEGSNAQTPEVNMMAVQAQLRNKAAELGATVVIPTSQQAGTGATGAVGPWNGSCPNCITMVGSAYRCSGDAPTGAMAAAEPRAGAWKGPTADPPLGAAGFTFGSELADTAKQCSDSANTWEALPDDHYRCSGTPVDTGFNATSRLKLCDGKLCSVILVVPTPEGVVSGWMKQYRSIQSALVKKYGIASTSESVLPEECAGDSPPCFKDGRASIRTTWSWPTGQSISLVLGRIDAAVSIGIIYGTGKQVKKGVPNPSAL